MFDGFMSLWPVVAFLVLLSPVVAVGVAALLGWPRCDTALSAFGALGAIVLLVRVSIHGPVHFVGDAFVVDRVAVAWTVFALVVVLAIRTFSRRLLAADPQRQRFHLTSAVAATTGVALFCASNLAVFAGVAVATSIASAAVVGCRRDALPVARRMAMVLLGGDALLVVAVTIIAFNTSLTEPRALAQIKGVPANIAAVLVVVAALARCAQIPFHAWLPRTLVAPTPASALLHAGLVNAGGVILIRFAPLVARSLWATMLGISLATLGMLVGAAVMQTRSEVKSGLVWSTTAQMGFMLVQVLVGIGPAAAVHLIAHGAYKSNLFLLSGSTIEHAPEPHAPVTVLHHVAALVVAVAAVGAAVMISGYHLGGFGGAAVLIPAFAVLTLQAVLAGRIGLPRRAARSTTGLVLGLSVGVFAYLALITGFEAWLGLAEAVPTGARNLAAVVVLVAIVGSVLTSGSRLVPARLAVAIQARVLAVGRRPSLQAAGLDISNMAGFRNRPSSDHVAVGSPKA